MSFTTDPPSLLALLFYSSFDLRLDGEIDSHPGQATDPNSLRHPAVEVVVPVEVSWAFDGRKNELAAREIDSKSPGGSRIIRVLERGSLKGERREEKEGREKQEKGEEGG